MTVALLGLGTALPRGSISQADAAPIAAALAGAEAEAARRLAALYRRSGVRRRGTVLLPGEFDGRGAHDFYWPSRGPHDGGPGTRERLERYAAHAPALAIGASREALARAGIEAGAITHLVTVSCTGFDAPGVDAALVRALELPPTVARTHVGFMGCHGAINGMRVGAAFAMAEPRARILLAAVEVCTIHLRYGSDEGAAVANALFADGAAAVVLGRVADPAPEAWRLGATGSRLVPDSHDAMSWRIGDHGFEMTLSARVPSLLEGHLRPWLEGWLAERGLGVAGVRSWAIHPGGPRIVESVAAALGLPEGAAAPSLAVLAEHGNMSSPTVLFIVDRLRARGAPRPCVALAFGPGLVAEAALFV